MFKQYPLVRIHRLVPVTVFCPYFRSVLKPTGLPESDKAQSKVWGIMQDEVVNLHMQLGHLLWENSSYLVRMIEKSSLETDTHFLIQLPVLKQYQSAISFDKTTF